jgi:Lrp/AsnC family leucine-responsive transcriptional regulator
MGTERIDGKDHRIISILTKDARKSLREIASEVKLSPSSVRNRITRLIDLGVIERFTIDVDYKKLGFEIQVAVLVTVMPGASEELYKTLCKFDKVSEVYWTAGPANFICIVRVKNMEEFASFLSNELESIRSIERIETLFLMPKPL